MSDMITDNDTARLHRALDRVLDRRVVARDAENRSNVARKAWQTRHETGGTKKFAEHEGGRPSPVMTTRRLKPFGWAYKPEVKTAEQFEQEEAARLAKQPSVKPVEE